MTVLPIRVRGLLTDAVLTRLRRESRDARKFRYSASQMSLSTKSITLDVKTRDFFCNLQNHHIGEHRVAAHFAVLALQSSPGDMVARHVARAGHCVFRRRRRCFIATSISPAAAASGAAAGPRQVATTWRFGKLPFISREILHQTEDRRHAGFGIGLNFAPMRSQMQRKPQEMIRLPEMPPGACTEPGHPPPPRDTASMRRGRAGASAGMRRTGVSGSGIAPYRRDTAACLRSKANREPGETE